MKKALILLISMVLLTACNPKARQESTTPNTVTKEIHIPLFNADSAFQFVAQQVAFGPRVPGSAAHAQGADWLTEKMSEFADTVVVQEFKVLVYTKAVMDGKNIISSFNPKASKRIILAAHWDSRPYADHDTDKTKHRTPIDGANDGASGVGVLMEVARLLKLNPLQSSLGIDIIFFDLEDYGPHNDVRVVGDDDYWALGSQHWSKTPHLIGYQAQFGILLDMVGAAGAVFPREYFSQQYAG